MLIILVPKYLFSYLLFYFSVLILTYLLTYYSLKTIYVRTYSSFEKICAFANFEFSDTLLRLVVGSSLCLIEKTCTCQWESVAQAGESKSGIRLDLFRSVYSWKPLGALNQFRKYVDESFRFGKL